MDLLACLFLIFSFALATDAQISPIITKSSSSITPSVITPSVSVSPIVTPSAITTLTPATNAPNLACASNPCQNSGTCVNLTPPTTNYECKCTDGFDGPNCEEVLSSTEVDFTMLAITVGAIKINAQSPQTVKDLLLDPKSSAFRTACAQVTSLFAKAFKAEGTFNVKRVICISFFFASVHSNLVIQTPVAELAQPDTLKTAVQTGLASVKEEVPQVIFNETNSVDVTDFNECNTTTGYCDQSAICVNLPGSFRCECADGFILFEKSICQKTVSTTDEELLVILLPIVAGGLLLLAIVVVCYLRIKGRKKYEPQLFDSGLNFQSRRLRAVPRYPTFTRAPFNVQQGSWSSS